MRKVNIIVQESIGKQHTASVSAATTTNSRCTIARNVFACIQIVKIEFLEHTLARHYQRSIHIHTMVFLLFHFVRFILFNFMSICSISLVNSIRKRYYSLSFIHRLHRSTYTCSFFWYKLATFFSPSLSFTPRPLHIFYALYLSPHFSMRFSVIDFLPNAAAK